MHKFPVYRSLSLIFCTHPFHILHSQNAEKTHQAEHRNIL